MRAIHRAVALSVGIVGLPNVGKSTLFNALSEKQQAEAANYPFCTIDPNVGVVDVPDPRMVTLTQYFKPQKIIPATVEFVDIAGLVKGASKGEGRGNAFLTNIRDCDAIAHVVRCFEDPNVVHVDGRVNPLADIETIETELILKDLESVTKRLDKARKASRGGDANEKRMVTVCEALEAALDKGQPANTVPFDSVDDVRACKELGLITRKPMFFVCNVKEEQLSKMDTDPLVAQVRALGEKRGVPVVVISAAIEAEIMQLPEADRADFLASLELPEPGLHTLIRTGYSMLDMITYFTCGEKEVRAWTISRGTKAPGAAGKIHTDFERGFIRAEVMAYEAIEEHKSEAAVKAAGKLRLEGKEYVVVDGDVMHFRFNV